MDAPTTATTTPPPLVSDGATELAEWVRRAQRREATAFDRLIRRFERPALAVAFAVTADAAEAGDVVQEAFVRAWQRLSDLKEPHKFGPWLCGIVRHLALDARRRIRPRAAGAVPVDGSDGVPLATDPAEEMSRRETGERLAAAVAALDETSRSVVVLRYYDGLSSKEIGELLGLAPTAVDMRLTRARRQLKELMGNVMRDA